MNKLTRLTTSRDNIYFPNSSESAYTDIVRKLGILEDIEEELGAELTTLFKALRDGVFINDDGIIYKDYIKSIEHWQEELWGFITKDEEIEIFFEDYGLTWALTFEELEELENE